MKIIALCFCIICLAISVIFLTWLISGKADDQTVQNLEERVETLEAR